MTQTVGGLVGVHRHVQHIGWVHVPKVGGRAVEFSSDDGEAVIMIIKLNV